MEALFCAKFSWKWVNYSPYQILWRGSCYTLSGEFKFHIREQEVKDEEEDRFENKSSDRIDVKKYRETRPGDHVLAPFGYELCMFLKFKGRHPLQFREEDRLLHKTLRRANIHVFWSKKKATVANVVKNTLKLCKISKEVVLKGTFVSWEPMPE